MNSYFRLPVIHVNSRQLPAAVVPTDTETTKCKPGGKGFDACGYCGFFKDTKFGVYMGTINLPALPGKQAVPANGMISWCGRLGNTCSLNDMV